MKNNTCTAFQDQYHKKICSRPRIRDRAALPAIVERRTMHLLGIIRPSDLALVYG
jgi:hypothetical protein